MTKTKRAIFSLLLSLIVLISALVFPASITHVSAEENVVSAFEERNVLDDLNGAVIGGEEFDLKDYPYNPFGRPQLIYFAEFGYSVKEDKQSDYGLYVYVYNPQEIALDVDTARNKIQFTYGDKESYLKYSLDFLNYSDEPGYEGRFYKFKVRLYDSERQDILNAVDYNGRVYKISGIELSYKGEVTEYSVAQTYTYTGFAKGYGSELATGDTVSAQVDGFEDIIELKVEHTFYRTLTSSLGYGHQNQVNTVYFTVPKSYFEEYDYLQRIKAEWWEFKTKPVVVTSQADFYNTALDYVGVKLPWKTQNSKMYPNITRSGYFDPEILWGFYTYSGSSRMDEYVWNVGLQGEPANYAMESIYLLFSTTNWCSIDAYDPYADNVEETGGVSSNRLEEYIFGYDKSFESGKLNVKDGTISADLFESDIDESRKVDNEHGKIQMGYSYYDFDVKEDVQQIVSWADGDPSWWDNWQEFGILDSIFGDIPEEEGRSFSPIYIPKEEDFSGSPEAIADRLMCQVSDVEKLRSAYEAEEEILVMFRFAVSDYQSVKGQLDRFEDPTRTMFDHYTDRYSYPEVIYVAQQSVFLDFDIIQLTFAKGAVSTIIPVVMSPLDIINDISTPVDVLEDEKDLLKLLFAILALIVVLVILAPLLPYILKFIGWILLLPFRLISWIISLFTKKNE